MQTVTATVNATTYLGNSQQEGSRGSGVTKKQNKGGKCPYSESGGFIPELFDGFQAVVVQPNHRYEDQDEINGLLGTQGEDETIDTAEGTEAPSVGGINSIVVGGNGIVDDSVGLIVVAHLVVVLSPVLLGVGIVILCAVVSGRRVVSGVGVVSGSRRIVA